MQCTACHWLPVRRGERARGWDCHDHVDKWAHFAKDILWHLHGQMCALCQAYATIVAWINVRTLLGHPLTFAWTNGRTLPRTSFDICIDKWAHVAKVILWCLHGQMGAFCQGHPLTFAWTNVRTLPSVCYDSGMGKCAHFVLGHPLTFAWTNELTLPKVLWRLYRQKETVCQGHPMASI